MINTDELFDIFDNDDRIVDVREITDGEMYDIICENKKIANQVANMLNSRLGTVAFGFMKTGSGGYYRFTIIPRDYDDVYLNESKKPTKTLNESKIDKGRVTYEFTVLLNNLGLSGVDYSNDENNKKRDEIIDMIVDLTKTMPRL